MLRIAQLESARPVNGAWNREQQATKSEHKPTARPLALWKALKHAESQGHSLRAIARQLEVSRIAVRN